MLDSIDHALLALLQENCRLSYADLGEKVGLSVSAVNERLKKLQASGIVQRFVAVVDPAAVGLGLCAYVEIAIERPKRLNTLVAAVKKRAEVLECLHVTGDFPLKLKVWVRDTAALQEFLAKHVRVHRGVIGTRVSVVLSQPKYTTALPLPKQADA